VALDAAGNLYIADLSNQRIRKVDASGTISTVAGNGTQGFSGDGGAATLAQLRFPAGVALDAAGHLYIADTGQPSHPQGGCQRDDQHGGRQRHVRFLGRWRRCDAGAASFPAGVALDAAGNLYIADTSNNRIRKVDASGTISTVAGGVAGFSGDGGDATLAQLRGPWGVALDAAGNLYIADTSNHRIRKVDASGTISTVAGNGSSGFSGDGGDATLAQLAIPQAWRWMRRATCTSRIGKTSASARWMPAGRSARWPATARKGSRAMAAMRRWRS
jgi:DNA-binding beta-propeller fold protein YncE